MSGAGRPPSKDRKTTSYTIQFPTQEFINDLDDIAASLGMKRKDLVIKMLEEGMEKYEAVKQMQMVSFTGEEQVQKNIEQTARDRFSDRAVVEYKDVVRFLMDEGVPGKQRVAMAKRLCAHFKSQGAVIYH